MGIARQESLFEPSAGSSLEASVGWISDVLFGPLAVTLCVLAVAFVGFVMLTGRMPVRMGLRVVLGCFVLLGAPVIASGLINLAGSGQKAITVVEVNQAPNPAEKELEPTRYNPYAQASVRDDR
ncbi:MAG: TrbC/VirB2 family protein [Erythrobacter sp.]